MMPSDCHAEEDLCECTACVESANHCAVTSHVAKITSTDAPILVTEEQSVEKSVTCKSHRSVCKSHRIVCKCHSVQHSGEFPSATAERSVNNGRVDLHCSACSVNGQFLHSLQCRNIPDTESCADHLAQSCSKAGKGSPIPGNASSDIDSSSLSSGASTDFSPMSKVSTRQAEQKGIDASDSARILPSSAGTSCRQEANKARPLPPTSQGAVSCCMDENQNIASERLMKGNEAVKGEKCGLTASEKNLCSTLASSNRDTTGSSCLHTHSLDDTGEQGQPVLSAEPGDTGCILDDPANWPDTVPPSISSQEDLRTGQLTGLSQSCCVPEPASGDTVESLPFELIQSDIVLKPQSKGCCDSHRLTTSISQSEGGLGASSVTVTGELYGQAESCCSLEVGQGSLRDIESLPASEINLSQLGTAETRLCGPVKLTQSSNEGQQAESTSGAEVDSASKSGECDRNGHGRQQQGERCCEFGCDVRDGAPPPPASCVCVQDIPEELILKIFSFFTPAELCRHITRVCRQWRCLAYDASLWHCLDLSRWRTTGAQVRQLVNSVPGAVRYLDISGLEELSVDDVGDVAAYCPELTHLDAGFVADLTGPMLQLVLMFCHKLHFLNLEGCRGANNDMMWAIAQHAGPHLKQLNFSHCFLTDKGLAMITKHLTNLTHINIDGIAWISDGAVRSLASTYQDSLECMELDGNDLTDTTLTSISLCHCLHTLSISFCDDLTDQSVKCLLRLKKLKKLVLKKGPGLGSGLFVELFSSPVLKNLNHLDLTECQQLSDDGLRTIAQTCAVSLTLLNLSWCWNITDKGMDAVVKHCRSMLRLYLTGLHRLEGLWLAVAVESMKNLTYINCEQCNEVNDSLIEEAVRNKPDLVILNYYGEIFKHNSLH